MRQIDLPFDVNDNVYIDHSTSIVATVEQMIWRGQDWRVDVSWFSNGEIKMASFAPERLQLVKSINHDASKTYRLSDGLLQDRAHSSR